MRARYRPTVQEIRGDRLYLRRLQKDPKVQQHFVDVVTAAIQNDYAEITPAFAQNLLAINAKEYDPYGYFTLGKEVWVAYEPTGDIAGFEVVTRKRGGSIKLGPTYIAPEKRGQRYAQHMILLLLNAYKKEGARKAYITAPVSNAATAVLDFSHLQFRLEALLANHYKQGSTERICGKFLQDDPPVSIRPHAGLVVHEPVRLQEGLGGISFEALQRFVCTAMQDDYDDIDDTFVRAIVAGAERDNAAYEQKPKTVFTLLAAETLVGLGVATPKRGGTYKVAPLLVAPEFRSEESILLLWKALVKDAHTAGRTKISCIVPVRDYNILNVLMGQHMHAEGVLRSPYKPGIDMTILSRRLP